ncbi:MAG TPA: type III pantothenate kinase [Phycisphaerae bacterium]|nr:type III pantothenate kinase [Phycisphaerae bacterium]
MVADNKSDRPGATPEPGPNRSAGGAVVVMDVGNSSMAIGLWDRMRVSDAVRVPTHDRGGFASTFGKLWTGTGQDRPGAVVVASVVPDAVEWIGAEVVQQADRRIAVVGPGIGLPCRVAVREPDRVGVDRVCAAAAAFECTRHACTVIDFGTAITVDLVDDEGTFIGGAILPGAELQARALALGTAALPEVKLTPPGDPVGRDTCEAIRSGILNGIPGAVRGIVEQYATVLNQWPQVVATGGDLHLFLDRCDFIDSPVPNLTLIGVGLAYARHRQAGGR